MSSTPDDPKQWAGIEVALEGTALHPSEVPLRTLIAVLEATAGALEAAAEEQNVTLSKGAFRLCEIREGSAALDIRSPTADALTVIERLRADVENRGKTASARMKQALVRLHDSSGTIGSVRLKPLLHPDSRKKTKTLYVSLPLVVHQDPWESLTDVYGRIVGINASQAVVKVRLRYEDGGFDEFTADEDTVRVATRLFNRTVRARVSFLSTIGSEDDAANMESLEAWEEEDTLDVLAQFRGEMQAKGIKIRASDWMVEPEDD